MYDPFGKLKQHKKIIATIATLWIVEKTSFKLP